MKLLETAIHGCFIIEPNIFEDNRGIFFESFNKRDFECQIGESIDFVQDNHSVSHKGVLRGLHFQKGEYAQAKLVRVIKGAALDVIVDLRKNSPTFGKHLKIKLSEKTTRFIFVPKGMAHGFLALSDETVFVYKCDAYYNKESERGIIYNDSRLNIDWEYPENKLILSPKDLQLPSFDALSL